MSHFFKKSNFYFYDTGERIETKPKKITLAYPVQFFDEEGRRLIPVSEWEGRGMAIKNLVDITLAEAKEFMKVEHEQEDPTIQELLDGAIDDISAELNRGWTTEEEIPRSIYTAIKQTTLARYENRGEMTIPASAQGIINKYRFNPGT